MTVTCLSLLLASSESLQQPHHQHGFPSGARLATVPLYSLPTCVHPARNIPAQTSVFSSVRWGLRAPAGWIPLTLSLSASWGGGSHQPQAPSQDQIKPKKAATPPESRCGAALLMGTSKPASLGTGMIKITSALWRELPHRGQPGTRTAAAPIYVRLGSNDFISLNSLLLLIKFAKS